MGLSGPFSLASRGFLAAPPLISKCSAFWNSKEGHGSCSLVYKSKAVKKEKKAVCARSVMSDSL